MADTAEERVERRKQIQRKRSKSRKLKRKKTPDLERKKSIGLAETTKERLAVIEAGIAEADADAKRKK